MPTDTFYSSKSNTAKQLSSEPQMTPKSLLSICHHVGTLDIRPARIIPGIACEELFVRLSGASSQHEACEAGNPTEASAAINSRRVLHVETTTFHPPLLLSKDLRFALLVQYIRSRQGACVKLLPFIDSHWLRFVFAKHRLRGNRRI